MSDLDPRDYAGFQAQQDVSRLGLKLSLGLLGLAVLEAAVTFLWAADPWDRFELRVAVFAGLGMAVLYFYRGVRLSAFFERRAREADAGGRTDLWWRVLLAVGTVLYLLYLAWDMLERPSWVEIQAIPQTTDARGLQTLGLLLLPVVAFVVFVVVGWRRPKREVLLGAEERRIAAETQRTQARRFGIAVYVVVALAFAGAFSYVYFSMPAAYRPF